MNPSQTIGLSGRFTLAPPFSIKIDPNLIYTCSSVRSLTEYIASEGDPLNTIYIPNGLTEQELNVDIVNNVFVLTLLSPSGAWINVLDKYVTTYPINDGVTYHTRAVVFKIGAIPVGENISAVCDKASALFYDALGMRVSWQEAVLSDPISRSSLDHTRIAGARKLNMTMSPSYQQTISMQETTITELRAKLLAAEGIIKSLMPPI